MVTRLIAFPRRARANMRADVPIVDINHAFSETFEDSSMMLADAQL
jgi:hypothetical protein